jgi:hypothetical protein
MSLSQVQHDFVVDTEIEQENIYPATDVHYSTYLNDMNIGSYVGSRVLFNTQNLTSAAGRMFNLAESYVEIPISYALNATSGCRFSGTSADAQNAAVLAAENAYACSLKGAHHLFHQVSITYNGVSINRNAENLNFYINEQLKLVGEQSARQMYDELLFDWDTPDSFQFNATDSVDYNNNTLASALLGDRPVNQGHINRMKKQNMNLTSNSDIVRVSGQASLSNALQGGMYAHTTGQLAWTQVIRVPLSVIHPLFKQMPHMASLNNLAITLTLNIGNSFTIALGNGNNTDTYGTASVANFLPVASSTLGFSPGTTCPFLVSRPSYASGTGLSVCRTGGNSVLTLTSMIGYSGVQSSFPCRIYFQSIAYTPMYMDRILKSGEKTVLYNDFTSIVTFKNIAANSTSNSQMISMSGGFPRELYILPYLRGANNPSFSSPLSSCPNTVVPCILSNVMLKIGSVNVFAQQLSTRLDHWDNNIRSLYSGSESGNSWKSDDWRGMIRRSDFEKIYGAYVFQLQKVEDAIADSQSKNITIEFNVGGTNGVVYDFVVLITTQSKAVFLPATGEMLA